MNYSNLHQKTNFIMGSDKLELTSYFLTGFSIPGINLGTIELDSRHGVKPLVNPDTLNYNDLTFELLIDQNFEIYNEFMSKIEKMILIETDKFDNIEFDLWIQVNNNKGNKIFKLDFTNCRLDSIGDISLSTDNDDITNTLSVTIKYDYYKREYAFTSELKDELTKIIKDNII